MMLHIFGLMLALLWLAVLTLLVSLAWMPGFFREMPKPEGGKWRAAVLRTTIRGKRERRVIYVTGLRRAYVLIRFWAAVEEFTTPTYDGELGIEWGISKSDL